MFLLEAVRERLDAFLTAPDNEAREKAMSITVGDCLAQDKDINAVTVTFLKDNILRGMSGPDMPDTILRDVSPQTFSQSKTWWNPLRGLCAVDRIVKLVRKADLVNLTLISTSASGSFDEHLSTLLQSAVC